MIGELFLRQIPVALQAGVKSGEYGVFGGVVRSRITGQIAGHLQEAGGLSRLAETLGSGPAAPLKLVGDTIQIVQNQQIKGGIVRLEQGMAMLNQLQVASLALGAVGIGVSVAGFAVMSYKIERLRRDVHALGDKMDRVIALIENDRAERLADSIVVLEELSRSLDQRWSLSDSAATSGWLRDADEARQLGALFFGRAKRLLVERPLAVEEAGPLLDAMTMASSLRIAAHSLAGEPRAAIRVANDDAERTIRLTSHIGATDLARSRLVEWQKGAGTAEGEEALDQVEFAARAAALRLRRREAAAATRAAPLLTLEARQLDARDWLRSAHEEQDDALLFLEA